MNKKILFISYSYLFYSLLENHCHKIFCAKEEREHQAYSQNAVQRSASVILWECISAHGFMGNWQINESTLVLNDI